MHQLDRARYAEILAPYLSKSRSSSLTCCLFSVAMSRAPSYTAYAQAQC